MFGIEYLSIGRVLFVVFMVCLAAACTALLDWHLHDSKVTLDEKSLELEGEPAEETDTVPSEEAGDPKETE